MADAGQVPMQVADAERVNFNTGVTAYLFLPEIEGFALKGYVYFDQKERFKNGRRIRTSMIVEFIEQTGYVVALTFTGSAYVLVSSRPDELPLDFTRRIEN